VQSIRRNATERSAMQSKKSTGRSAINQKEEEIKERNQINPNQQSNIETLNYKHRNSRMNQY
jgi:hypothetical protein